MSADGHDQRRLTDNPMPDSAPDWSPDGERLLFTRGDCDDDACDLYVMDADGGHVDRLTRGGNSADGAFSPDGTHIVFWSSRDYGSALYTMDADGSDLRKLTGDLETAYHANWCPDGTIIFSGSGEDEVARIYSVRADGSDMRRIARATRYWVDEPDCSPDGRRIAFFSDALGRGEIWIMKRDGTQQRALTSAGDSHHPSWQPGKR